MKDFDSSKPYTADGSLSRAQSRSDSLRTILAHLFIREKDPAYILFLLGGLTIVAFILRLLDINKFIAYDEAYTFIHFASRPLKYILADYSAPNNHIFHTILVGIAYRLFGGEAWVLRLPAFIAGVLMVPAMYVAARRFFSASQALGAAAIIAVLPVFINYSVNGRGYTMLILFALLLANFAGILVKRQTRSALIAFGLTTVLGFYTIPIFLYPWAGIALWVAATYLLGKEPWQDRSRKLIVFLGLCVLSGLVTLLFYSPVILFGSGLGSLISNEIVESLDWSTFLANLDPRILKTWNKWMIGISPQTENIFLGGFLLSLLFYRRASNQKLPMQVFLVLAVLILLLMQRVTPLPRIWLYLEAFYLMFAAAGLVWFAGVILRRIMRPEFAERTLALAVLLVFLGVSTTMWISRQQNPVFQDRDRMPEEYAADYLVEHLQPEDTLVATGPVDIQTAYYLSLRGIPFERFYRRDHHAEIQNALVLVRENSKYRTPEDVVGFFKLEEALDVAAAQLVFEYASVQIYSVPAR
jgi:hypothetical protein